MKELGLTIEGVLLLWCAWAFLALAVGWGICVLISGWKVWRGKRSVAALSAVGVLALIVGGTKPATSRVNFPRTDLEVAYLIDNGSYVSNSLVHVDFTTFLIPQNAPVTLAYWPNESTNEADIVELFTLALSAWQRPLDLAFENAISNRWYCYTTWTPGPTVHTNGVWVQSLMTDTLQHRDIIPIRKIINEDGDRVSPPQFKEYKP